MSDSEEDYMSASFTNTVDDVRPSLVKSKVLKRKYEIEKKAALSNKLHKTRPLREIEEENRNAGLDTALAPDNKGFAMLQKMGYKPGMKLGVQKAGRSNAGLAEPIKVKVKMNRGGLGQEEVIRQKIHEREMKKKTIKIYKEKEAEQLTEEFLQRMRKKVVLKHTIADLNSMKKACEKLDSDNGIEIPIRPWFWFSQMMDNDDDDNEEKDEEDEDDGEDDLLDPEEQLSFINDYLRSKYFYCTWCGTKYDNDDDRDSNCPGSEKDDHE